MRLARGWHKVCTRLAQGLHEVGTRLALSKDGNKTKKLNIRNDPC